MLTEEINVTPQGWTKHGMSRGWMKPAQTPQDRSIKALRNENEQLKAEMAEIKAAVAALTKLEER